MEAPYLLVVDSESNFLVAQSSPKIPKIRLDTSQEMVGQSYFRRLAAIVSTRNKENEEA